jgi:uncharacterized protein (DUF362 family)
VDFFSDCFPPTLASISIKINLCDYRTADSGATTDPVLLKALTDVLRARFNPKIIFILENDATSVEAHSLFSLLGFRELAQRPDIKLVNVADGDWIRRPLAHGRIFQSLEVPRLWLEADLKINFAKLKTNSLTKTSACLKNMFGLLREKRKSRHHRKINEVIADINQVMKSDLCLVDGLIAQEGLGPAFGIPKRCNLLTAGLDPVAVDACCARIMGFYPRFIRHIYLSHRDGVGNRDFSLETDIPKFRYRDYRFKYSRLGHIARSLVRRFHQAEAAG